MSIGAKINGGNPKDGRRSLDHYPTPRNVTIALMNFLNIPNRLTIWEPACGPNKSMSKVIAEYGHNIIETDLIFGDDYLKTKKYADAIITNPPFNIADAFIAKSVNECSLVAMLLKATYWHAFGRYDIFKSTQPSYVLPLTWRPDFLEHERGSEKGSPMMEMMWCVWDKNKIGKTIYEPLVKPVEIKQTLFKY